MIAGPLVRGAQRLNLVMWLSLAGVVAIAFNQSFHRSEPRDFLYFYAAGRILDEYPAERLYDYGLQKTILQQLLPMRPGVYGSFPYPPWVAVLFRPLAALSYWTAYRLWTIATLILYLAGLSLLLSRFIGKDRLSQSILCCYGLSFWFFISWMLLGGQISAIGFFGMALAICLHDAGRRYASGLALSLCLYKPTLLILVLPMLLVTRRSKTLAGFGLGAVGLAAIATLIEGRALWLIYPRVLMEYARYRSFLPLYNYVDIGAFSLMIGRKAALLEMAAVAGAGAAALYLVWLWSQARRWGEEAPVTWLWAATLTWTLVLNVYVPIYDCGLAVIAIIVTAPILLRDAGRMFIALCTLLLVSSYVTTLIAIRSDFQAITVLLAGLGTLQLKLLPRPPSTSGPSPPVLPRYRGFTVGSAGVDNCRQFAG
jgi:hypothetical protein